MSIVSIWENEQRRICFKYKAEFVASPIHMILGAALNLRSGKLPINGLRHPPEGAATGWFLWAGEELSSDPDFFQPLHVQHVDNWRREVLPYLGLAPGWRFLIAPRFEDVWFDPELLGSSWF